VRWALVANMNIPSNIENFLKGVGHLYDDYYYINVKGTVQVIPPYFMRWNEILKTREIQEEWGISKKYIVFCGDMHTVIAVKKRWFNQFAVVLLNEERHEVVLCKSVNNFECLLMTEESYEHNQN